MQKSTISQDAFLRKWTLVIDFQAMPGCKMLLVRRYLLTSMWWFLLLLRATETEDCPQIETPQNNRNINVIKYHQAY